MRGPGMEFVICPVGMVCYISLVSLLIKGMTEQIQCPDACGAVNPVRR